MGNIIPRLETISILTLRKTNAASAIMALVQLKVLRLLISILSMSHQTNMPKEYEPDYCIGGEKVDLWRLSVSSRYTAFKSGRTYYLLRWET